MDKKRLHYLLQQYLYDKATPEEKEELFACNPLLKFAYNVIPDVDQGWQRLRAAMHAEPPITNPEKSKRRD